MEVDLPRLLNDAILRSAYRKLNWTGLYPNFHSFVANKQKVYQIGLVSGDAFVHLEDTLEAE